MSVVHSSNFEFPDGDMRKKQELFMDTSYYVQQNRQHRSGLSRYRSAPSSVLDTLVNGSTSVTTRPTGFENYQHIRSSTPEMETLFMLSCNDSANSNCPDQYGEKPMKQDELLPNVSQQINGCSSGSSASQVMLYQSLPLLSMTNGNTVSNSSSIANSAALGNSFGLCTSLRILEDYMQPNLRNGNGSNLVRQSSSPAEFFSNLCIDNGLNEISKVSAFQACNGTNDEPTSTSKLYGNHHISFSSRPMPGIPEVENESMGVNGPENGSFGTDFMSNLGTDSWKYASLSSLKRERESDEDLFCGLSRSRTNQNQGFAALTHHLSLPKTCAEMAVVEKLWQFQDSPPLNIRAKRGCATHPRSIAERVRRTRISERMRKLQGLFPNMDKQTNTVDMLDMAVEYIKDLQKQVQTLMDTKAKCRCSSEHRRFSNIST